MEDLIGGGNQGLEAALSMVFFGNEETQRSHSARWWHVQILRQRRLQTRSPRTSEGAGSGGGVRGQAGGVAAVRSAPGDSDPHTRKVGDTGLCSSH